MLNWLTAIALVLLALAGPTRAEELTDAQTRELDAILAATRDGAKLPSLVALIDRGGETLYASAQGQANLSHGVDATMQTAYGIGSVTKTFTGLAVTQLVVAGEIDRDATVKDYLPDYDGPGGRATVAQLLTHSSGIPSYNTEISGVRSALERNAFSRDEIVALFEKLPLKFEPGEKFSYSNSGYYLLGLIIEAVTGEDYYSYLQQAIFEPLKLSRTTSGNLAEVVANMARGYAFDGERWRHADYWHYLVPFSAGSLVSTAGDLVAYRRGVFHSPAIPDAVREALLETMTLAGGQENKYTLGGLVASDFNGHRKLSHAGDIWGYASNHAYYPDEDLTIVLLTNRQFSHPALSSIEAKLARVVLGLPQPDIRRLSLDAAELERYAGDYAVTPVLIGFEHIGFVADGDQLFVQFGGTHAPGAPIPLLAQGDGIFRAPFDDEFVFRFDQQGERSQRVVMSYRDGTIHAQRTAAPRGSEQP
jgi:CubicO group peptidase (beta-lactamase class C family)